ncbi:MAG: hypothetical protein RLZ83_2101 [Pseudomonadota bacterium]|jgi:hypothetical protein
MRQAKSLTQQHRCEVESCACAPRPAQAGVQVLQDPIQGGLAAEAGRPASHRPRAAVHGFACGATQ